MVRYPVNTTINICSFASLIKYWESQGSTISSASELIHYTIEMVSEVLIAQGKAPKFADPKEADIFISERGFKTKKMAERGFNSLIKHLQGVELSQVDPSYTIRMKKPSGVSKEQMENYVSDSLKNGELNMADEIADILKKGQDDALQAAKEAHDLLNPLNEERK